MLLFIYSSVHLIIRQFILLTAGQLIVLQPPTPRYCAFASEDRCVYVRDLESGESIVTFSDHDWIMKAVDFSADGKYILASTFSSTVSVYRVSWFFFISL